MNAVTIGVCVLLFFCVLWAIVAMVRNRKKGGGCGGTCNGCPFSEGGFRCGKYSN
ncbi:MAG: FeoB-associated Cys-rich membrane protein [Bacteroidales bacterium]|nr:FeoB-associated Cys-rich membrane protein [Bacteroidales bacterium]